MQPLPHTENSHSSRPEVTAAKRPTAHSATSRCLLEARLLDLSSRLERSGREGPAVSAIYATPTPSTPNPNPLEADPPRDLHIPRTRPFCALQPGNRTERLIIQNLIRHIEVPMIQGIGCLRAKLEL
jgi:hypothetical protein